jgi:hypothetical protein
MTYSGEVLIVFRAYYAKRSGYFNTSYTSNRKITINERGQK